MAVQQKPIQFPLMTYFAVKRFKVFVKMRWHVFLLSFSEVLRRCLQKSVVQRNMIAYKVQFINPLFHNVGARNSVTAIKERKENGSNYLYQI
jgi:acyl dehydratase